MDHKQMLPFRIKILNNQVRRLLERSAIADNDAGLTGMQYAMLGYITEQDTKTDVFQRDIEAEFNIRRSTATGLLQMLEKNGYILRVPVPNDARLKKIILTDKAKILDNRVTANLMKLHARMVKGISEDDLALFDRVLQQIMDNTQD